MRLFFGFIVGLVLAVVIAATALKVAWGDVTDVGNRDRGEDKTETIAAADFDRIDVAGVFELDVAVGGDYAVTLSGKEGDLAATTARVDNGVLILETDEKGVGGKRHFIKHGVTAKISMPALAGIDATGVVDGEARNISAETFTADVSGVGELTLSGTCATLDADVSGVGELDAQGLECRAVKVSVSGVGEASVNATESVDADISGIGKIDVYGSPSQVSKSDTSPFGRIRIK